MFADAHVAVKHDFMDFAASTAKRERGDHLKNKKFRTKNNHLRMIDAIRELATKLSEHGLSLKICQCCKYFQPNIDGSTNMIKGFCKYNFAERVPGDILPTHIWNTCEQYEPINVVSLFESLNNR